MAIASDSCNSGSSSEIPLYVDMDGTLLKVDTLHECFLAAVKKNPLVVFFCLLWLWQGKAYLKSRLSNFKPFPVDMLPVNESFVEYLWAEKRRGRQLVLATAGDSTIANAVAARFPMFNAVLASDGKTNLSGRRKREMITAHSGGVYDYAGNAYVDLPIWEGARNAIVVNATARLARKVRECTKVTAEYPRPRISWRTYAKALRLHQWLKNVLIFAPVLASHQVLNAELLGKSFVALLAFGLCASSVYVLNDLLDLESDRKHPRKLKRAFAAGQITAARGVIMAAFLLITSGFVATYLPLPFGTVLIGYFLTTFLYSVLLKRLSTIDIFILAGLYTLRIIAGAAATGIHLSFWLLAFSMFLFISLAAIKRVSELVDAQSDADRVVHGRGYAQLDMDALSGIGISSGFSAVLVLALYIKSPEIEPMYRRPEIMYLLCPLLLYWLSRCWVGARRGNIDDDPMVFAVRDRVSQLTLAVAGLLVLLAL